MKKNGQSVSVVMCTYNGARFLREQLDSILRQTYPVAEIVVQDDCSTDNTAAIVEEYVCKHQHIRFIRNEQRMGINPNFFSAMRRTTGRYIAIADQDDIWEHDKIEKQMDAIGDNLLCAGFSRPFTTTGVPIRFDNRIPNHHLLRMIYVGMLSGHTLLLDRQLLELIPDNHVNVHRYYDIILGMVAQAHQRVVFLPQVLVNHRRHVDAASYHVPTDNSRTMSNVWRNVWRTMRLYIELRHAIRERLKPTYDFLACLRGVSDEVDTAVQMLQLHISTSPIDFLRRQALCVKHCDKLFYACEKKSFFNRLRAWYFPISCSEYFRYLSKKNNR